jgi:hypothetical protein
MEMIPSGAPEPAAIYARAVRAMDAQQSPAAVTYDETFTPRGLGVRIIMVRGAAVVHIVFSSDATPQVFQVTENSARTELVEAASGQRYAAALPFWSATWLPLGPTTPADQSTVIGGVRQKMLGDLSPAGESAYSIALVGVENVGGFAVYHLHMTAQNPATHPLTDLFVDEQSYRVRRAVAAFRDTSLTSVTGDVVLNFASVGNYWMVTSGQIDATVHAFFRTVSGSATFAASRVDASGTPLPLSPQAPPRA